MPVELNTAGARAELVVADYRVERVLRRRSESDIVYQSRDVGHDRRVELRVIETRDSHLRARFASEAALLRGIDHPHLPKVLQFGETEAGVYIATAFLDGTSLADAAGDGGLPPIRLVRLLGDVADALDAVHREGLVHGDVRPENVTVVGRQVEYLYLVDFTLGTLRPPGSPASTPAGDIRGLARALFECLTGTSPGARRPSRLREARPDLPDKLDDLLARAMSGHPRELPRSADELIAEGARALVGVRPSPPPARRPTSVGAQPAAEPSAPQPRRVNHRPKQPATRAAAAPATVAPGPAWPARVRSLLAWRVPPPAAAAAVLAAAAAGLLLGTSGGGDEAPRPAASPEGIRIKLPHGWSLAAETPRVPRLELAGALAAGANAGPPTFVAGRLPGLRGSVYPGDVARRVDRSPPKPRPVRLGRYQALRYVGLEARGGGRMTLFVAPTGGGTLVAACLGGATPGACDEAAGSIAMAGAAPSSLVAGKLFAARLDRVLRTLNRRRVVHSRSLRLAATPGEQQRAAAQLARAHRDARRALARGAAPPAAVEAGQRTGATLGRVEGAYARLARAARRRSRPGFDAARRSVRRAEAGLRLALSDL